MNTHVQTLARAVSNRSMPSDPHIPERIIESLPVSLKLDATEQRTVLPVGTVKRKYQLYNVCSFLTSPAHFDLELCEELCGVKPKLPRICRHHQATDRRSDSMHSEPQMPETCANKSASYGF